MSARESALKVAADGLKNAQWLLKKPAVEFDHRADELMHRADELYQR